MDSEKIVLGLRAMAYDLGHATAYRHKYLKYVEAGADLIEGMAKSEGDVEPNNDDASREPRQAQADRLARQLHELSDVEKSVPLMESMETLEGLLRDDGKLINAMIVRESRHLLARLAKRVGEQDDDE